MGVAAYRRLCRVSRILRNAVLGHQMSSSLNPLRLFAIASSSSRYPCLSSLLRTSAAPSTAYPSSPLLVDLSGQIPHRRLLPLANTSHNCSFNRPLPLPSLNTRPTPLYNTPVSPTQVGRVSSASLPREEEDKRVSRSSRSDTYIELSVLTNRHKRWILGVAWPRMSVDPVFSNVSVTDGRNLFVTIGAS
ncbi:hypothetical protein Scep_002091 [Stephania cephalantha]|uniref:Uncharacterized protein n=1 Tax=Stephania cephalantha TaxID=152367 RepID=A0AAP0Q4C9_9MAGN